MLLRFGLVWGGNGPIVFCGIEPLGCKGKIGPVCHGYRKRCRRTNLARRGNAGGVMGAMECNAMTQRREDAKKLFC